MMAVIDPFPKKNTTAAHIIRYTFKKEERAATSGGLLK
jgi:hypothetical protein